MKNIVKKLIVFGLIISCAGLGFGGAVFAKPTTNTSVMDDGGSAPTTDDTEDSDDNIGSCETFLGMSSWDCGVDWRTVGNTDDLKNYIWIVVANIASDATLLAVYLALGFVIYGGYLYIFSGGDVGKMQSGKKTLTTSFIGLGIVMLANVIFNGIKFALIENGVGTSSLYGLPDVEADIIFTNAVSWVIGAAGFAAAIFLVYGGISYMTASGDAGKLTKAKNAIIYSLIGLAIVGLSEIILGFVSSNIKNAAGITSYMVDEEKIALMEEKYEK